MPDQYGAGGSAPRPRARPRTVAVATVLVLAVAVGTAGAVKSGLLSFGIAVGPDGDRQEAEQTAEATGGPGQSVSNPSQIQSVMLKAIVAAGPRGDGQEASAKSGAVRQRPFGGAGLHRYAAPPRGATSRYGAADKRRPTAAQSAERG
ncbi:hypothetical protein AB0N07_28135 [Streptomyces sp. NPDC051172]|uniref:hypothetical protein n=1 Tax=Streptomyces sp. NPDC051172 TaxID=3155796 RepID=UPI00343A35CC